MVTKSKVKKPVIKDGYVKYGWSGERMKAEDFIVKISKLVRDPINTMHELDGDMYMSDFQKLSKAADLLHLASEEIKERKGGKK